MIDADAITEALEASSDSDMESIVISRLCQFSPQPMTPTRRIKSEGMSFLLVTRRRGRLHM